MIFSNEESLIFTIWGKFKCTLSLTKQEGELSPKIFKKGLYLNFIQNSSKKELGLIYKNTIGDGKTHVYVQYLILNIF